MVVTAEQPYDVVKTALEQRFTIFSKVEQGQLLAFAGKPIHVCQYAIGNPLLAIEMIERIPEVALYAPLRITVYETGGRTNIAYDRFTSLLSSYGEPRV